MRKYKRRRFVQGECMHIYQRSVKGFNLFYDLEDFIVFYTIVSVLAKVYGVVLMEMCLMIDHVHLLMMAESIDDISAFVRHYTSVFVMESNNDIGRSGPLFHKSFGSAPKKGSKKIRSAIVYVGNNPVEKKLCARAEEYRWNFLAYLNEDFPFSRKIPYEERSRSLKRAIKEVNCMKVSNRYLSYAQVRRLLGSLSEDERAFLTDYIITSYYPFDKQALLSFYEGVDEMLHAMSSTAGSDYDIREVYYSGSDNVYWDMIDAVRRDCQIVPVRGVVVLPVGQKLQVAGMLQKKTNASKIQLMKFLHLETDA